MQPRRLLIACLCLLALGSAVAPAPAQTGAPAFEAQGAVSGAESTKYPHLAVDGPLVHLAANTGRADASYWSKQDIAPAFGAATTLGPAAGQPDYSTASIAVGPGGALFYAWVNQPQRAIYMRSKRTGADWGPAHTVVSGQPFPVHPELAVASDGAIFVVWRNPDQPFVYRRSTDGGLTWGNLTALSAQAGVNAASIVAGPSGSLAAAYTVGESDRLQVYVATWGGADFARTRLSSLSGDYADPSLSFTPDGRLLVAWRGVAETGGGAGVFYAERQTDGSYQPARLISGRVAGRVSLSADSGGNLHMLWTAAAGDGYQLWYAVKPAPGAWSSPVAAPSAGGVIFNAYGAGAIGTGGAGYAHAASEVFVGTRVGLRHYRFSAGLSGAPAVSARPLIERGAARARGTALAVSFSEVAGAPTELRYRWGAPPTDADPWQPFAETISVPAPTLADPARCAEAALFTQVRAAGATQAQALSDTLTLDSAVQARVSAYHSGAAPGYT
ncbi:MAG: exo-alpha-sialidase, partial [Chloroflexales bacterium]|nr:exo-alpha-sialidase [Chloroflexales bacterium]